ncbi:hypothetical protein AJ79_06983 [Helicocarpus griseus UAMH5409]|uniref:Phosphatidate phosphatase APP1 catalytic domain-containing protein n=1 Tax=Helicocarpus griseus UAMH5409 TaxID=1447875 RepID=A0A2B7X7Q0_9EURO|nr:hypothetical protein AJ79_06983 [Helicocarpus griseus UAMH5409]
MSSNWARWPLLLLLILLIYPCPGSAAALAPPSNQADPNPPLESVSASASFDRLGFLGKVEGFVKSKFRLLGHKGPSSFENRFPSIFQLFPTAQEVVKVVNAPDTELRKIPTEVIVNSAYANWTDKGWSIRFRGSVYKQPEIPERMLHTLATIFLLGSSVKKLSMENYAHAVNMTRSVFMLKQSNTKVSFRVIPDRDAAPIPSEACAGPRRLSKAVQTVDIPGLTNFEGDFDSFVEIKDLLGGFPIPGNMTRKTQRLQLYSQGTDTGNATAYLVPPEGLTLISDIDDVLRVSQIYKVKEGMKNLVGRTFYPWMNMPDIFANWSRSLPDMHFHYLTISPEQLTRPYVDYIFKTYPPGSFDTRIFNFTNLGATLSIREFLLDKIFQTFPHRKFILVGDTTNFDIMSSYPQLVTKYPGQVQCIFLRNTSATDSSNRFPYNTKWFKGMNQRMYMFFRVPDDLKGLDIENGQCYNASVPQNLTYGWQGLPFGFRP